jgi:hypothetical protein
MNFDSFSHGQVQSKIWLCEKLEPWLAEESSIWVLGSWYNLTGFLLYARRPYYYKQITGYDSDPAVKPIADSICRAWTAFNQQRIVNHTKDCNTLDWSQAPDCVINSSAEHFDSTEWWDHVPSGILVCIQSSNVTVADEPWIIKQPNPDINTFRNRYPLENELFLGVTHIRMDLEVHGVRGYDRYMIIGHK